MSLKEEHLEEVTVKRSNVDNINQKWLEYFYLACLGCSKNLTLRQSLKGLSHEIFRPVFWSVWMRLGLNGNRLWF
jgi:hypothetical protein